MNVSQHGCGTVPSNTFELNQEATASTESVTKPEPEYIPLPILVFEDYFSLIEHDSFAEIKSQFLKNIQELKERVRPYCGDKYTDQLDVFYHHIDNTPDSFIQHLMPIYKDTRYQVHQIVEKLKIASDIADPDIPSTSQAACTPASEMIARIDSVLHDSLEGVDLCFPGIHSRFMQAFSRLEAQERGGYRDRVYQIKSQLFKRYIESFMAEKRREGTLDYPEVMEIHIHNTLHNLCCGWVHLDKIHEPYSEQIRGKLQKQLFRSLPFSVNEPLILRKLTDMYFNDLSTALERLEKTEWLTRPIKASELTGKCTLDLDGHFFKEVNLQFKTTGDKALGFWSLVDLDDETGMYSLQNSREKLLAWIARSKLNEPVSVFTPITSPGAEKQSIMTIDKQVYWVVSSEQPLHKGATHSLDFENFTPLELHHLKSVDFSSWSVGIAFALLTQAAEQSHSAESIFRFLTDKTICPQLKKVAPQTLDALNTELENKAFYQRPLKTALVNSLVEHVIQHGYKPLDQSPLWYKNQPLFEATLAELTSRNVDLKELMTKLPSDALFRLPLDGIKQWVTPQRCRQLYREALENKHGESIQNLLLTGHCDDLVNGSNKKKDTALTLLSRSGLLKGVDYLTALPGIKVNHVNKNGRTALMEAAAEGHLECINLLLDRQNAKPNKKGKHWRTALMLAVTNKKPNVVEKLLAHPDIDVNPSDDTGRTPLLYAALNNDPECLEQLLAKETIKVNMHDFQGRTALHFAALYGYKRCVELLCRHSDIFVNPQCADHFISPLYAAAQRNHPAVVEMLLAQQGIDPNLTNGHGSSALITAARHGHTDCARQLLRHPDTDPNVVNIHNDTAYTLAKKYGYTEIVQMLESDRRFQHQTRLERFTWFIKP